MTPRVRPAEDEAATEVRKARRSTKSSSLRSAAPNADEQLESDLLVHALKASLRLVEAEMENKEEQARERIVALESRIKDLVSDDEGSTMRIEQLERARDISSEQAAQPMRG